MANHKQSKKRIRQTAKRTANNRSRLARVRTFLRKFEEALASKDKGRISEAFRNIMSELQRAVSVGVLHKNTVARKISRLNKRAAEIQKQS